MRAGAHGPPGTRAEDLARAAARPPELDATIEAVGEFVARVRRDLRAEFAEQLEQLRAELNVAKAHNPGQVIDLPALPLRRKSDAA